MMLHFRIYILIVYLLLHLRCQISDSLLLIFKRMQAELKSSGKKMLLEFFKILISKNDGSQENLAKWQSPVP